MEATTLSHTPPRSRPVEVGLVASLLVVAAGAWAVTGDRMGGMDAGPGTELGGLGWFAVVWVTMMAAMMLPSIPPMVLAYARVQIGATPAFVAGYLLTWAAVGTLGYVLVEGVRSLDLGVLAWDEVGRYVAGGAILAAASTSSASRRAAACAAAATRARSSPSTGGPVPSAPCGWGSSTVGLRGL